VSDYVKLAGLDHLYDVATDRLAGPLSDVYKYEGIRLVAIALVDALLATSEVHGCENGVVPDLERGTGAVPCPDCDGEKLVLDRPWYGELVECPACNKGEQHDG